MHSWWCIFGGAVMHSWRSDDAFLAERRWILTAMIHSYSAAMHTYMAERRYCTFHFYAIGKDEGKV